jgi:hypothetical protein
LSLSCALVILLVGIAGAAPRRAPVSPPAVPPEDARRSVSLLADFYRENLLLTHTTYINGSQQPAAVTTRKLFAAMTEKGWPEARWLSVNGKPLNVENAPRDPFEKEAARAIRAGEMLVERVEKGRYRAVAAVPFNGACLKCHLGDKPSDYVGGISFLVRLR